MTATATAPMPLDTLELIQWVQDVILEVVRYDQQAVEDWTETDLLHCLDSLETQQWKDLPDRVRTAILEQAKEDAYERIGEDYYEFKFYG